jgi:hypothetical protein
MSANTQSTIDYLNFVTRELNRYIPLAFLTLGTIGNFTNILVFTRPRLRRNPCSIYFISSSIANFLALYVGLITPFLGLYNLDPTQYIDSLCKIRFYLRFTGITLSTWFILLACIDRYISSSINANLRSWSSLSIANRIVFIATVICFIVPYSSIFYCYTVTSKSVCTTQNNICLSVYSIVLLIFNSGIPPILMVVFSILTIRNVNYRRRILTNGRYPRRDVELVRILLIQVSIIVLFAVPVIIQKIYSLSTSSMVKSALGTAIDNLLNQIYIEILYISSSTTFYIYSITSKKYRREVVHILSTIFKCHQNKNLNRIQPADRSPMNQNSAYTNSVINVVKLKSHNRQT